MLALAAAGAIAVAVLWPRGRDVDVAVVKAAPLTQSVVATGRIATPARIAIGSPIAASSDETRVSSRSIRVKIRTECGHCRSGTCSNSSHWLNPLVCGGITMPRSRNDAVAGFGGFGFGIRPPPSRVRTRRSTGQDHGEQTDQ